MAHDEMLNTLRSMVSEHGFDQVNQTLTEIEVRSGLLTLIGEHGIERVRASLTELDASERHIKKAGRNAKQAKVAVRTPIRTRPGKSRANASQYVAKMDLESDRSASVIELADRFDNKTFLPTFGDIVNFCEIYRIDVPASRSRASAIPRVFKFLASMESHDIQQILKWGMFSGPSRLGPIADAIRRNGRAARARAAAGSRSDANEGA